MSARIPPKDPQADLKKLRKRIDAADRALLKALGDRMAVVERIGRVKVAAGVPLLQKVRWKEVMAERLKIAGRLGLSGPFTNALYTLIHQEALRIQTRLPRKKTRNSGKAK
jgi:chorismate mutase